MISNNFKKRLFTSIVLLVLLFVIFFSKIFLVFSLLILGVFSVLEFLDITKKILKRSFKLYLSNFVFIIYIFTLCSLFTYLSVNFQFKLLIFLILLACTFSDIGGYVIGNILKGPKLTKISPKKTISGALGSILFTMIVLSSSVFLLTSTFNIKILIIALITSTSCQIGDLFFSYLKRKAKIKDTGSFLPGHGGVLDRIDGILLGLPIGLLSVIFIY